MRAWALLACGLLLAACGVDGHVGARFRAERDLFRANQMYRDASIRPSLVKDADWRELAARYQGLTDRYSASLGATSPTTAEQELQTISAGALFAAARIFGSLQDSTQVLEIFGRLEREFGHMAAVAGEVALARAGIAEGRHDAESAIRYYQTVVDRVEPDPQDAGVAGAVLDLPLRIARLRANGHPEDAKDVYLQARRYYEDKVASHPGTLIQIDARTRLAEIAADLGDWRASTRSLRQVEADLRVQDPPPRDPAVIRYYIAGSMSRGDAPKDSLEQALESVLADYPQSDAAIQARGSLADLALVSGQIDEAIAHLDRLRADRCELVRAGERDLVDHLAVDRRDERVSGRSRRDGPRDAVRAHRIPIWVWCWSKMPHFE